MTQHNSSCSTSTLVREYPFSMKPRVFGRMIGDGRSFTFNFNPALDIPRKGLVRCGSPSSEVLDNLTSIKRNRWIREYIDVISLKEKGEIRTIVINGEEIKAKRTGNPFKPNKRVGKSLLEKRKRKE